MYDVAHLWIQIRQLNCTYMEKVKCTFESWPVFGHRYVIGLHGMLSEAVPMSVIVYTQNIRDNGCPV